MSVTKQKPHSRFVLRPAQGLLMDIATAIIVLLWILIPNMNALSSQCATTFPEYLPEIDVCIVQNTTQYLTCKWNEKLVIYKVILRVCKRNPTSCCHLKPSDMLYDTDACLNATPPSAEKMAYSKTINEVLKQCSEKRYCILEGTTESPLSQLKSLDVGTGRVPAGVMVVYNCEKAENVRISMCEDRKETSAYVSLNGEFWARRNGNLSCTCDIQSTSETEIDVHVLDVRLRPQSHLRLENIRGEHREYDPGSVTFGSVIRFNYYRLRLTFSTFSVDGFDKIWIKVTAPSSMITASCQGTRIVQPTAATKSPLAAVTESQGASPEWYESTPLFFLIIGFLATGLLTVILVLIVMACKR